MHAACRSASLLPPKPLSFERPLLSLALHHLLSEMEHESPAAAYSTLFWSCKVSACVSWFNIIFVRMLCNPSRSFATPNKTAMRYSPQRLQCGSSDRVTSRVNAMNARSHGLQSASARSEYPDRAMHRCRRKWPARAACLLTILKIRGTAALFGSIRRSIAARVLLTAAAVISITLILVGAPQLRA
jgi:hypothetical protein